MPTRAEASGNTKPAGDPTDRKTWRQAEQASRIQDNIEVVVVLRL
jgi:hypothetical protein